MGFGGRSMSYRVIDQDILTVIVPTCTDVVLTSTSPNHDKKLDNYSFQNL